MRDRLKNLLVIAVSCLAGFVICEVAYRFVEEWRERARWEPRQQISAFSSSVWDFDAALGYAYRPHARVDSVILQGGVPRLCETIVTGPLGSPGKGVDPERMPEVKFIVLGNSFTATVYGTLQSGGLLSVNDEPPLDLCTSFADHSLDGCAVHD